MSTRTIASSISSRSPNDPPEIPDRARTRAGQHGHLRVPPRVPERAVAARRGRPAFDARFRPRHDSVPRAATARRSRTASSSSCVRSKAETVTYWRDVGTLDAYFEANIDLTDVVPELDLYDREWPIWTYAKITPPAKFVHDVDGRRGMGISSLVSGGCIVSGSHAAQFAAVRWRARAFVWRDRSRRAPAARDRWTHARLRNVIIDAGVQIPDGLVVGEDPELDAHPLPPHRARHLPHHAADARPHGAMTRRNVARALGRLRGVSRWSRPGGSRMSSARCRPRWRAKRWRCARWSPGIRPVLAGARRMRQHASTSFRCTAAPARLLSARAAGLDLFVLDAPHLYARAGNPYAGAGWARLA